MNYKTIINKVSSYLGLIFKRLGIDRYSILDALGLFLIGIISLGYLLLGSMFAERHIQFSFLDFPVFIGEFLLFGCLILLFIKWKKSPTKFNSWFYLLFFYFIFVIAKALWGYLGPSKWGPLAFRHAALFYYPLFAIYGYSFYHRSFLNKYTISILSLFFIVVPRVAIPKLLIAFSGYFSFTFFILAFVFIKAYPNKVTRYTLFFLLLFSTPYRSFFQDSRAILVGNTAAIIFIVLIFILRIRKRLRVKMLMVSFCLCVLALAIFKISLPQEIISIVDIGKLKRQYLDSIQLIAQEESDYRPEEIKVALYNPKIKPQEKLSFSIMTKSQAAKRGNRKEIQSNIQKAQSRVLDIAVVIEKSQPEATQPIQKDLSHSVQQEIKLGLQEKEKSEPKVEQAPGFSEKSQPEATQPIQKDLSHSVQQEIKLGLQEKSEFNTGQPAEAKAGSITPETLQLEIDKTCRILEEIQNRGENSQSLKETERDWAFIKESQAEVEQILIFLDKLQVQTRNKKIFQEIRNQTEKLLVKLKYVRSKLRERKAFDARGNSIFRILIWKDALTDLVKEKPLFGFDFGKPFRSRSIEMAGFAAGEWSRDGWIELHNSYLQIIYRAGIIGILYILFIIVILARMAIKSIYLKKAAGILLCGALISLLVHANFAVILELPYNAIPLWALLGLSFAYLNNINRPGEE